MKMSHSLTLGLSLFIIIGATIAFDNQMPDRVNANPTTYQIVLNDTNQPTTSSNYAELTIEDKYVDVWYSSFGSFPLFGENHMVLDNQGGVFYNNTPIHGIESIQVDWSCPNPNAKIGIYFGSSPASYDGGGGV